LRRLADQCEQRQGIDPVGQAEFGGLFQVLAQGGQGGEQFPRGRVAGPQQLLGAQQRLLVQPPYGRAVRRRRRRGLAQVVVGFPRLGELFQILLGELWIGRLGGWLFLVADAADSDQVYVVRQLLAVLRQQDRRLRGAAVVTGPFFHAV